MNEFNLKLIIEYDGTAYKGWQKQKKGETIQGVLEDRISIILRTKIKLFGASRTDAGVHAIYQVANTAIPKKLDLKELIYRLNAFLPQDIAIRKLEYVPEGFHARFSAQSKIYNYSISPMKSPTTRLYSWFPGSKITLKDLNELAPIFVGTHDFKGFAKKTQSKENTNCTIIQSYWKQNEDRLLYVVEGDRFLHGLVRGIVGSMVQCVEGKVNIKELKTALKTGIRDFNIEMAPAHGLWLMKIIY